MRRHPLSWPARTGRHLVLATTATLVAVPFVWMLSLSFKAPSEITAGFSLLPQHWHAVENYTLALTASPLLRFLANGFAVCAAILAFQILISAPAAYAFAKLRFPGRQALFALVLIGLLIPHQVLALPLYVLCWKLGILNTYAALILPFVVSPLAIFLFRQFFLGIPDDIIHAARLDGLSETAIVFRIMLPMALPAVIAFGALSVVVHWNDLFWPSIAITSEHLKPPTLGIIAFRDQERGSDYGPLMAAATIVVLPLLAAFLFAQRWFIAGLNAGAVK